MVWNVETFNAPGSRIIIVAVHVGAVKLYVQSVEALRKMERRGEDRMNLIVIDGFLCFASTPRPPNVLQIVTLVLCFPYFTDNFNKGKINFPCTRRAQAVP
jgi:hypothetical protein